MTNTEIAAAQERTRYETQRLADEMGLRGEEVGHGLARMCGVSTETVRGWLGARVQWSPSLAARFARARRLWTADAIVAEVRGRPYVRPITVSPRDGVVERAWAVCWPDGMHVERSEARARARLSDIAALEDAIKKCEGVA